MIFDVTEGSNAAARKREAFSVMSQFG